MKKLMFLALITVGLGAHTFSSVKAWGANQPSQGIAVAVLASGLSPQDIYFQVGLLAEGRSPIKRIVIQFPDQNVDDLVADLQQRFSSVVIEVQYTDK